MNSVNSVKFEGKVLHSDIVFLPEKKNISVCRIVLKNNMLACMPVFCFGKMAVEVKKAIKENENICVSGKIVTYIFHDAFDTEKVMTMILAKEIVIDGDSFANTKYNEELEDEEACLSSMCNHNMLPVSETDYEVIARELTGLSW